MTPVEEALELVRAGVMRVDFETGIVHRTFTTTLYTYERPVGTLRLNGYVGISLGARKSFTAHRLVWAAAHGHVDPAMMVNHKNGIKHDNRLLNLEEVTPQANIKHAYRTGLIPSGENHYWCKLKDADVPVVLARLAEGFTAKQVAEEFGVSSSLIYLVRDGVGRFAQVSRVVDVQS